MSGHDDMLFSPLYRRWEDDARFEAWTEANRERLVEEWIAQGGKDWEAFLANQYIREYGD